MNINDLTDTKIIFKVKREMNEYFYYTISALNADNLDDYEYMQSLSKEEGLLLKQNCKRLLKQLDKIHD